MGRLQNSIDLAKSSWNVLRDDKQLTVLPLLSGLSALVVALVFFGPVALIAHNGAQGSSKPLAWILGAVGYLAVTYVVIFFNAALVFAADKRLRGEPVTIGEAVHAAGARAHVLLPWAVLSATVSLVLRAIEERSGIVGRIVGVARRARVVARDVPRAAGARDRADRPDRGGQAFGGALQAHLGREHDRQRGHRYRRDGRDARRCASRACC